MGASVLKNICPTAHCAGSVVPEPIFLWRVKSMTVCPAACRTPAVSNNVTVHRCLFISFCLVDPQKAHFTHRSGHEICWRAGGGPPGWALHPGAKSRLDYA